MNQLDPTNILDEWNRDWKQFKDDHRDYPNLGYLWQRFIRS